MDFFLLGGYTAPMTQATETAFDVIILGAGASGLMCASVAAGRGKSALLIDHAAKTGRKLSITGGGKCNLTNRIVLPRDYAGENPHFCRSALSRFTPEDMLGLAREAGIELEEREQGQIFCKRSAKDLVNFLVQRCEQRGCRLLLEEHILAVESIAPGEKDTWPSPAEFAESCETDGKTSPACENRGAARPRFRIRTRSGKYEARSLVIAMGSPAWPQVGASGRGYELARAFGHRLVPIRPALVALVMPVDWPLAGLAGISTPASIRVLPPPETPNTANTRGKRKNGDAGLLAADNLALLFTHTGISGPAALQASLYWRKGCRLVIDFLPGLAPAELLDDAATGKLLCRGLLRRHLPDRLADALLPAELADRKIAELPRRERERLCALLKTHEISPMGSEGFARAEAAAGGVSTEEIFSRSMESARIPGLFFCGEILDVTGRLGGYNLHWAFASGSAAGGHV